MIGDKAVRPWTPGYYRLKGGVNGVVQWMDDCAPEFRDDWELMSVVPIKQA